MSLAGLVALAMAAVAQPAAALTSNQVQLIRARDLGGVSPGQGARSQNLVFDIAVKNLAFTKQVFVRLKDPCGGNSWTDLQAQFVSTGNGTFEIWRAGTTVFSFGGRGPFTFSVGYTVNGTTYWDTNNGSNYVLPFADPGTPTFNFGTILANATNVLLSDAVVSGGNLSGNIHLPNLAFMKNVNVIYSTNNFATQTTVAASYLAGPNGSNIETWSFSAGVGSATSLKLYISYTVNGVTYFDNNFTQNYTVTSSGANGAGTSIPNVIQPFPPPIINCS